MQLRYYQKEAIESFYDYVCNNPGKNPLIVLPTAAGKSIVIAEIIKMVLETPKTRCLNLAHSKDLVKQNALEYLGLVDDTLQDVGVYSAGLNSRDTDHRVIFAGIQSVHARAYQLGWFDVILVDEVHRVDIKHEGTYRKFLAEMQKINPKCVIVGFSATAFRLKGGSICDETHEDRLFHDICYEASISELMDGNHFKNKDHVQYLCKLITKNSKNHADLSHVKKTAGEYNLREMEDAFDLSDLITKTVKEIVSLTGERNKVLIFTAGIKHGKNVLDAFLELNLTADIVHSQRTNEENDEVKKKFKDGEIKYCINIDSMTTGYNQKDIDCIAMIRSTASAGLWIQIVGRGTRLHETKKDCLVLDFGSNLLRFGPIDKIEIRKKQGGGSEVGTMPMKECPQCHAAIHLSAMECPECGYLYPEPEPKHEAIASEADIISQWKNPETIDIEDVEYSVHDKPGKPKSMRVDYFFNGYISKFSEWICLEHDGFAKRKAQAWIDRRLDNSEIIIETVQDAIDNQGYFIKPKQIIVDLNDKFPRISGYIF